VYEDVNQSIQHVHRSGLIHRKILSEPLKFFKKNVGNTAFMIVIRSSLCFHCLLSSSDILSSLIFFYLYNSSRCCLICYPQNQVFRFLKMLKEKGKKLFLLTNSPFYFVDGGMRYLLEVEGENLFLLTNSPFTLWMEGCVIC
jgi:hypothetical protein